VGQIEDVAQVAGRAYIDLITQISEMPTDDGLEPAGGQEPGREPVEPDMEPNTQNERAKTQAFKTRNGPRIKPALLIKIQSLNAATEGFSKFALSLRDLGMVLVPEKNPPESGTPGNGALPPGTLIQINQMLAGAMPQLRNVTPAQEMPPPPPPPPPPLPA